MKIENVKIKKEGDKSASRQLSELIEAEARKVKLVVPFKADGFKAEKSPLQPDKITPIIVEKANLISPIKEEKKIIEEIKKEPIKKVTKKKK